MTIPRSSERASPSQDPSKNRRWRPLKQALIYALFGACWIVVTDWMAAHMSMAVDIHAIQRSKGLVFVLATSLLVYWLARRAVLKGEHESLQEKLTATESVFRATLKSLGEAVVLVDLSSQTINDFNTAAEKIFGYRREEVIGRSTELLHVDRQSFERFGALIQPILAQHAVFRGEYRMKRKDGTIIDTDHCVSTIHGEGGWKGNVVSIVRDNTERQESRRRLESSERRFRTLFEKTSEGVAIADLETFQFVYVNPALAHMLNYTEEEMRRLRIMNIHPADSLPGVLASFKQFSQEKNSAVLFEIPCLRRDGQIIYADINGVGMDIDGVRRAVGFFRDVTELRAAQRWQKTLLNRLECLYRIDQTILSLSPLEIVLRQVAQETRNAVAVDAVSILIKKEPQHRLETGASVGFSHSAPDETSLHLDEGLAGHVLLKREPMTIPDIQTSKPAFARRGMAVAEGLHGYACCPIIIKGSVEGVLEVFKREAVAPGAGDVGFLQALAIQAAIAIDNVSAFTQLQTSNAKLFLAYDSSIEGWSRALDCRDEETHGHSQRVTEITVELARRAGVEEGHLKYVRWGSLLHDIGKMGVPDRILLKSGKLTDEEWSVMRRHPIIARDLLRPIKHLEQAVDIPYCHHEKFDGSGYPQGLTREDIPLAARLFAVVDVWDALRSDRPYRKGWSKTAVLAHLKKRAGSHLDPELVDLFCEAVDEIPACSSPHYATEDPNKPAGGDA